jgi:hypothetical protein
MRMGVSANIHNNVWGTNVSCRRPRPGGPGASRAGPGLVARLRAITLQAAPIGGARPASAHALHACVTPASPACHSHVPPAPQYAMWVPYSHDDATLVARFTLEAEKLAPPARVPRQQAQS